MKKDQIIAGAILAGLFLVACSAAQNGSPNADEVAELTTIRMNSSTLTSYGPIFIADAEGFFAEEGIQIEYIDFNRSAETVPLLITGDIDVFAGSLNAGLLNTLGHEGNVKVVADRGHDEAGDACIYLGVLLQKDLYESGAVTGPADLEGRTLAVSMVTTNAYVLTEYLAQAGLTWDDVTVSELPSSAYADALATGAIDIVAQVEPRLTNYLEAGDAVMFLDGTEVVGTVQSSVLAFGARLLVEERDLGVRFLKAYLRGIEQYNLGKTERNIEIMAEKTGESEATLLASCWLSFDPEGAIDFEGAVAGFQQWNVDQGNLDEAITEEQFWDPTLVEDAFRLLDH